MSKVLFIAVVITFVFDMILTYRYVRAYRDMYPKNDWTLAESNPILRYCMKYLGLERGMVFGSVVIFFILSLTVLLLPDFYQAFLLGMYFMANVYHFVNWQALKRLKLHNSKGGNKNGIEKDKKESSRRS